jgi:hypothetical protein
MPAVNRHHADHTVKVTITPSPRRCRTRIHPKSVHTHSDAVICIHSDGQQVSAARGDSREY